MARKEEEEVEELVEEKPVEEKVKALTPEEMWANYVLELKELPPWNCDDNVTPVYEYHTRVRLVETIPAKDDNIFEINEPLQLMVQVYDKPGTKVWYPVSGVPISIIIPDGREIAKVTDEDGAIDFKPFMKGKWMFIVSEINSVSTFNVI